MGSQCVTVRVHQELADAIEEVKDEEHLDRSTAIRQLLERGIADWRLETAISRYRNGEWSIGRAAEHANLPLWRFLDHLSARNTEASYGHEALEKDIDAVRTER